jgi:hypothetical protein
LSNNSGISLPFSFSAGDVLTGTFSLDYADLGEEYIAPFIRRYPNQPDALITGVIGGISVLEAPSSFRHDVEVWNNSDYHNGRDLFFMGRQTLLDPRYPGLEVSLSISGIDSTGLTVSSLALPTTFHASDFGGLGLGLGIIDPNNLSRSYQMSASIFDIQLVPEPATLLLLSLGAVMSRRKR